MSSISGWRRAVGTVAGEQLERHDENNWFGQDSQDRRNNWTVGTAGTVGAVETAPAPPRASHGRHTKHRREVSRQHNANRTLVCESISVVTHAPVKTATSATVGNDRRLILSLILNSTRSVWTVGTGQEHTAARLMDGGANKCESAYARATGWWNSCREQVT